ncbi:MAG: hypothetical protein QOK05_1267 [Chloroflexota bacterium]|jgi:Flp pilus assembly pilin Flp|nr:hypothetical protein [Chloroflexota bacterium]
MSDQLPPPLPGPFSVPAVPGQAPGYTPQGYPQGYPPPGGIAPRANNKAIASLAVAIGGLVFAALCACVTPFAGVASIVLAHQARQEIRNSGGAETGGGMTVAGEIIGWIDVALILLVVIAAVALVAGLILIGNQTTDVFSNISDGLANP